MDGMRHGRRNTSKIKAAGMFARREYLYIRITQCYRFVILDLFTA